MRASSVMATFMSTRGRWCWIQRAKPSLRRRASAWQTPTLVSNACRAQCCKSVAGDGGVGIDGGGDDAGEAGLDEGIGAGRRAAGDVAGLEGDVGRAALNAIGSVLLRFVEGDDFGVIEQVVLVPALADDLAGAVENDAADGGIGRGDADAAPRQLEGALHPVNVLVGLIAHRRFSLRMGTIKCKSAEWPLAARFGDTTKARIAPEQQIAGMESLFLKIMAVTGKEKPMADLVAEQLDGAERGELSPKLGIGWLHSF